MAFERKKVEIAGLCRYSLLMLCFVAAASGMGWLFDRLHFPETNIVLAYMLAVVLTSRFTRGYLYGIAAAIFSTCAFNYFFTAPYLTLSVDDPTYFITFAVMTGTALITSALTSKVKQKAQEAQEKEAEASALYRLTSHLTDAADIADIAGIAVQTISGVMNCRAACLCFDGEGRPEGSFIQQKNRQEQVRRSVEDRTGLRRRIENLHTAYDVGEEFYDWPIYGRDTVLGLLRIPKENAAALSEPQLRLLRSMIESTAMAMDRFRSAQERLRSSEEAAQERYRGNLLRAISHDLRTPLSGIMGTSEMLMDMTDKEDGRYALAEGIYRDADWLHALVENILSLTRLQEGKLVLNKQPEAVEEVVGFAVMAMGKRAPGREITLHIPEEVLMVPMDARLIGQVLVNLLDNAVKHTLSGREISITVQEDAQNRQAVFRVEDRGSGICEEDLPHIFQTFYTAQGKGSDSQRGVGLGLAICESIVTAHGGVIAACNRRGGGAAFTFTLPMGREQHGESE